jgi:hypothetical protein
MNMGSGLARNFFEVRAKMLFHFCSELIGIFSQERIVQIAMAYLILFQQKLFFQL